jgi:hypothetical protein
LHTSAVVSHIGTPEWQSFELRMLERARVRRAEKRRRKVRHAVAAGGFILLAGAAGAYVGSAPNVDTGYLNRGFEFLRLGTAHLDRYLEILNTPPPAVRRPGLPFVPRSVVPPPMPTPMRESETEVSPEPMTQASAIAPRTPAPERADAAPTLRPRSERVTQEAALSVSQARSEPPRREAALSASRARNEPSPRVFSLPPSEAAEPSPPIRSSGDPPRAVPTTGFRNAAPPLEPLAPGAESAPAPTSTTSVAPAPAPPPTDQRPTIRETIERYRIAYERLDASAARAVWPGVEEAALARAFESLSSQRLTFEDCSIEVSGVTATASCRGTARAVPRVGGGSEATRRNWRFRLRQSGDRWIIDSTQIR